MGTVMHNFGAEIYAYYQSGYPPILDPTVSLAFAGSFIACLFWVSHTSLVPSLAHGEEPGYEAKSPQHGII